MGRRSRSPDASLPEAPAEKVAKTSDSEDALSDNSNNSSSIVLHDSGIASLTPLETTPSRTSSNQTVPVKDLQPTVVRAKRQDWCRWPICKEYYKTGICSNAENGKKDGALCQLAHIREEDGVSVNGDSFVRVCFDSMGLVQPSCRRAKCTFFHPPKHIRDQIIAKRHAQYLQEKQAKIMRNQISNALMQMPSTTAVNPYVYFPDPLSNFQFNQFLMYNNYVIPDWTSANLLATNKTPYVGTDVNAAKLSPTVSFDSSTFAYPSVLPSTSLIPTANWAEYLSKMSAQYLQQRTDPITSYNWLPMTPVTSHLLSTMATPQAAFAIQQLGALNSVAPPFGVPQPSNVVPYVQGTTQLSNATR
ncbi:Muscleblind-like protein 1 [Taenia crassiceps]|uniref:Muscleblind-like protein 1 n=1 Tax=Taenia crassiceps TaxID=6207 RepID=A0ABR4Q6D3_9CEST